PPPPALGGPAPRHDEGRIQPAIGVVLAQELDPRQDRSTIHVSFQDALAVERGEDLGAVLGGDDPPEVRRPHAILSPAGIVGPPHPTLDALTRDGALARAEAGC